MINTEKGVGLEPYIKGVAEATHPALPIGVHPSRQQ